MTGRGWARCSRIALHALLAVALLFTTSLAGAEPQREARFIWNTSKTQLFVDVSFRDVIDGDIRKKLQRGLPTTIVFTGTVFQAGSSSALSTTAQTCKITWHVWDEVYLVEITRPGGTRSRSALTVDRVILYCAEAQRLLVATSTQVALGTSVYMNAKVLVNPVSEEILQKIKRWVSRPTGTGTAAPGDALFSTFTGLFLQRFGDAERELKFTTKSVVPIVPKPPPKKAAKE